MVEEGEKEGAEDEADGGDKKDAGDLLIGVIRFGGKDKRAAHQVVADRRDDEGDHEGGDQRGFDPPEEKKTGEIDAAT